MIALIALLAVSVVSITAMALIVALQGRHQAQLNALLAQAAAERYNLARERWDLATRITAPEVVRAAPPAPPASVPPEEVLQALGVTVQPAPAADGDEELDESFLVGTGPDDA